MNEPMTSAPIRSAPAFHARCRLPRSCWRIPNPGRMRDWQRTLLTDVLQNIKRVDAQRQTSPALVRWCGKDRLACGRSFPQPDRRRAVLSPAPTS